MCPTKTAGAAEFRGGSSQQCAALLVGIGEPVQSSLTGIFESARWKLHAARDCREALAWLRRWSVPVVISESEFPGYRWTELLRDLEKLVRPPLLVVTTRLADESLWAEVLNLGGFDVLAQPLEAEEVVRVIGAARRRFEAGDGLRGRPAGAVAAAS